MDKRMWAAAAAVLRANDVGGRYTRPAAHLYPHQWSWDSAITAVGWAHLDADRAFTEFASLFEAQWADGRIPQIAFRVEGEYFPGPERWAGVSHNWPIVNGAPLATSALIQPPVHASALEQVVATLRKRHAMPSDELRAVVGDMVGPLLAWHRYLVTNRDPGGSGLVTLLHPWESGTDNSPRWDVPLDHVPRAPLTPFARADVAHVADPGERPTDADYDRYITLVDNIGAVGGDDAELLRSHPFRVGDVFFTSLLVASHDALYRLADFAGASRTTLTEILAWRDRNLIAIRDCTDPATGRSVDVDRVSGRPLTNDTFTTFAPLFAGHVHGSELGRLLRDLGGTEFAGRAALRWPLTPSTSPTSKDFDSRKYWRGPNWPVVNWLVWRALLRCHATEVAATVRDAALAQLSEVGFAEYVEPFTGQRLGAREQSWSAAVALDFLAGRTGA